MTAPTVTPAQIAADLRAAAPHVRDKWTAGVFYNPATGRGCLSGWIATAIHGAPPVDGNGVFRPSHIMTPDGRDRWTAAEDAVADYLAATDQLGGHSPLVVTASDWNDQMCAGGDEAAQVLADCAARLDPDGAVPHA